MNPLVLIVGPTGSGKSELALELAKTFGAKSNASEYSIPLSQGELASLIGATRETTSTTLNALARRGIIRLGRRQLIVPSVEGILAAADQRSRAAKVS